MLTRQNLPANYNEVRGPAIIRIIIFSIHFSCTGWSRWTNKFLHSYLTFIFSRKMFFNIILTTVCCETVFMQLFCLFSQLLYLDNYCYDSKICIHCYSRFPCILLRHSEIINFINFLKIIQITSEFWFKLTINNNILLAMFWRLFSSSFN